VIWVAWLIFGVGVLLLVALALWLLVVVWRFRSTWTRAVSECAGRVNPLLARAAALRTRADSSRPEPLGQ
jgi:hypothetical protein